MAGFMKFATLRGTLVSTKPAIASTIRAVTMQPGPARNIVPRLDLLGVHPVDYRADLGTSSMAHTSKLATTSFLLLFCLYAYKSTSPRLPQQALPPPKTPFPRTATLEMAITFEPLHGTFVAECKGVDFSKTPLPDEDIRTIREGIAKYGVLVFRSTGLDNDRHIAFSEQLGELDDIEPYNTAGRVNRLAPYTKLFDVSNLDHEGNIAPRDSSKDVMNRANKLFHCDSSFNARRAGLSLLLAHELPPSGYGEVGNTEFADSRTAYADLPQETKDRIKDYTILHSHYHSRRMGAPGHPLVMRPELDPESGPISKHTLVQTHETSGRPTIYIGAHCYKIEGLPIAEGQKEIADLLAYSSQPKYVYAVKWHNKGDLTMWDNTSVQHRAVQGNVDGNFRRDMRRTTVHDSSKDAYGLNGYGANWRVGLP